LRFNGKGVVVDVPSSVAVVVPARNEERRLAACLSALQAAVGQLLGGGDATPVRVVLVLDRCTDGSAAVAARWPSVQVVTTRHGRVGAARAAGIRHAAALAGVYPETTWIATTDADCAVPADWLQTQLHFARAGADLLLGMVRPHPGDIPEGLLRVWHARHEFVDGHGHVHGANMGVRGSIYRAVGGFPDRAVDEDVMLVDRIRRHGGRVISTSSSPVLTSSRLTGRTPGGMAEYLRDLLEEPTYRERPA
jgi:glycosyltransferase involved in cell wall biosynthesis